MPPTAWGAEGARPAVILERFTPEGVLQAIQDHRITIFPGVPTMFNYLVNFADRTKYDLKSLRIAKSAGALLPAKLMRDFQELYGVPLVDGYGITEAHSFVTLNDPKGKRPDGSCGKALEGVEVRIVDREDREVPPGERGELVFRGPNLPVGYVNRPEATAAALRGGWYHSGDVAYMDAEGYIYIGHSRRCEGGDLEFMDKVPKTASGKTQRFLLRQGPASEVSNSP